MNRHLKVRHMQALLCRPMLHTELPWRTAPKRQSIANIEGETTHASLSFSALTQCADAKALCLDAADSLHMRNSEEPPATALVPAYS